jgi:tetratricopeptide (TPR) repeat protein
LETALQANPEDLELLSMLAQAYIEADDAEAAESAVTKLVAAEASHYGRFIDVARLYLKADEADDAVRVLTSITEQMLSGREDETLMELLNEVLSRDPEHVEALRLLVRVHAWQRDDEKQHQALERLAEAAEAAGLHDVERSALLQLAQFAPDQRYLERLHALGHAESSPPPPPDAHAEQQQQEETAEEVPSFESFALMGDTAASTADAMGMPAAESAEFEFNSVAPPAQQDPAASFADLNEDWASGSGTFASAPTPAASPASFQEYDFHAAEPAASPQAGGEVGQPASTGGVDPRHEAVLRQELDSVDFYLDQGYLDIAADTLDMLERQFGAHAEIDSRRARLGPSAPRPAAQPAAAQPAQTVEFEGFASYDVAEEVPTIEPDSLSELKEAPPEPAPPQPQPPQPAQSSAPLVRPGIDPGLAAIFDEFREAAEEESPEQDGDYETHYNLGIAYQEMELLDEAVEEFQAAAALTSPRDGTPRYLQCCNMLGHCFMRKEMPRLAVMWFKKGLEAPGHTEDEYQALRYDLGTAYEQMGELDSAIDVFTEVYGIDISYRGVADKLRELQAQKASK